MMDLSTGVNVGQLTLAFGTMLVVSGVAWGMLLQRVKTLEREVAAMSGFSESIARIDERTQHTATQINLLANSWLLKDPPGYESFAKPSPRRRP